MKPVKIFQIGEETLDIKDQTAREKIEKLNGFETVIDPDTGRAVGYKTTAGGNTVFPIPTLYDATGNNSDGAMTQKAVTDAIQPLSNKIQSFEDTKSEIASSGLGVALGLAISNTWAQIVAKLKTVVNRGAVNATISTSGGSYTIPEGFHNGSGKVTGPTLSKLIGNDVSLEDSASLLSDVTAYGKNGTKYTGTIPNKGSYSKWFTPSSSQQSVSLPAGYYTGGTIGCHAQSATSMKSPAGGAAFGNGSISWSAPSNCSMVVFYIYGGAKTSISASGLSSEHFLLGGSSGRHCYVFKNVPSGKVFSSSGTVNSGCVFYWT